MQIARATYANKYRAMFRYSKDKVTVLSVLDTRRPKSDGKYPIKIQVCFARKQKYYSTSKTMTPEEWRKMPTSKAHYIVGIREDVEASFNIIRDAVKDLTDAGCFSFTALNTRLSGAMTGTINTAFVARIEAFRNAGQIGSAYIAKTALLAFERFAGKEIPFSDVTPTWLQRYENYEKGRGLRQTTISIYLRQLRTIMYEARTEGVIKESDNPFGKGKFSIKGGEGRKMALTIEQIGKMARYSGDATLEKYRDYWMFLYLCNGINVADLARLKFKNMYDGEISFVRRKTERTSSTRKEIRVIVTEPMRDIIRRRGNSPEPENFIFPILSGKEKDEEHIRSRCAEFTYLTNKYTSKLGEMLGIGKITTYTARHSFATVLKRSGTNIAYISEALGHSDLKTTENYLACFEREEREKNAMLLTDFPECPPADNE